MAELYDRNIAAAGRIRDVSALFTIARAEFNPFSTQIKKGKKPASSLYEWRFKNRFTPVDSAIADGVDVQSADYTSNQALKFLMQGRIQKGRVAIGVTDIAEELGQEYAVDGTLLADSMADGITQARENLELTLLKSGDSQGNVDDNTPMKLRGLVGWIRSSNPGTPDLPIPTAALVPSGSISTGNAAAADVTEDQFGAIMKSVATTVFKKGNWDVYMHPDMMDVADKWMRTGDVTDTTVPLRRFNADQGVGEIKMEIRFYSSSFGRLKFHLHFTLPSGVWALIVDMDMVSLRPVRAPKVTPIPYFGGGNKRIIEYIYGLEVSNPLAMGKITT